MPPPLRRAQAWASLVERATAPVRLSGGLPCPYWLRPQHCTDPLAFSAHMSLSVHAMDTTSPVVEGSAGMKSSQPQLVVESGLGSTLNQASFWGVCSTISCGVCRLVTRNCNQKYEHAGASSDTPPCTRAHVSVRVCMSGCVCACVCVRVCVPCCRWCLRRFTAPSTGAAAPRHSPADGAIRPHGTRGMLHSTDVHHGTKARRHRGCTILEICEGVTAPAGRQGRVCADGTRMVIGKGNLDNGPKACGHLCLAIYVVEAPAIQGACV